MKTQPLKLLIVAYALSAAAAVMAAPAVGMIGAVLVFWIGGAVCAVALAVTPGVNRSFRVEPDAGTLDDRAALEEALRRWEADRQSDSVAAERRRETG
jgi:hypothetical protein